MERPKGNAKRLACDRCRGKRVRCPRVENGITPCTRCAQVGARCVTAAPGNPGRPRKSHQVSSSSTAGIGPVMSPMTPVNGSPPVCWSAPRDGDHLESHSSMLEEPQSGNTPTGWFPQHTDSLNLMGDLARVSTKPSQETPFIQVTSDGWTPTQAPAAPLNFFNYPMAEQSPVSDHISILDQLNNPSQHQQLLSVAENLEMMYTGQESSDIPDVDVDSLFEASGYLSSPSPVRSLNPVSSLIRFGEKMERRVSAIRAFLSDSRNVVQKCPENDAMGMATENPVAVVLTCTKEFIDIIENLTAPSTRPQLPPNATAASSSSSTPRPDYISTEIMLMVLSSYLALMRLYDSLIHDAFQCLSQIPPETIKSIKVKAVFRIGGISSLQDMPGKAYALGMVEVIQHHILTVEQCLGLPEVYCLSKEPPAPRASRGMFTNGDRARLLHTVMSQQDVRSQRGNKSYVESIRESIRDSVALFTD